MNLRQIAFRSSLSASVAGMALLAGPAFAQTASTPQQTDGLEEIVVSGSRIERAGFDQPTPTTVLGADEIQRSARLNLQQSLNDLPQMRNSVSPNQSIGNTSSGTAPSARNGSRSTSSAGRSGTRNGSRTISSATRAKGRSGSRSPTS